MFQDSMDGGREHKQCCLCVSIQLCVLAGGGGHIPFPHYGHPGDHHCFSAGLPVVSGEVFGRNWDPVPDLPELEINQL